MKCRSTGKHFIGLGVREEVPYNHSDKLTVTMAKSGGQDGRRWLYDGGAGTSVVDFYDFIIIILRSIGR